ncbi:MAG: cell wall hydrolase [Xanthomonadales bacterium]|nr:cell wall hydrolase [Xanthomonadales bacterium]
MTVGWILWLASILPQPHADRLCLATTIYLEARSEPFDGQLAIAEVALARLDSQLYGDTLCSVLSKPRQFALTTVSPNYRLSNPMAWKRAWQAMRQALIIYRQPAPERQLVSQGATHFVALAMASPNWARGEPVAVIGDHSFYRLH